MGTNTTLVGHTQERYVLGRLLDGVAERGEALLIRGEAGIGKSVLISWTIAGAEQRGFQVLTTTGRPSDAHRPFAGLHRLMRPLLPGINELPAPQRDSMLAAFEMTDTTEPDFFLVALAALDLLAQAAARAPMLLVAEDAQWVDPSTNGVLAFVARRIESERAVLLAAVRAGFDDVLAGLPELIVHALDRTQAEALLDAHDPTLSARWRERVLADAAGNPLALVELPIALRADREDPLSSAIALTPRLERAFAARAERLPAATRTLLLVAALDNVSSLAEVVAAGAVLDGTVVTPDALQPAIGAGLVAVDDATVRFRHPLVRSAIAQVAGATRRRAGHAAMAQVLSDNPDRRIWHRAAAKVSPDEGMALELDGAAERGRRRGAMTVAIAAQARAAQLSHDPARRGTRLLATAEMAFEVGRRGLVVSLLDEAERLELAPRDRSRLTWLRAIFDDAPPTDARSTVALIDLANASGRAGDNELALRLLLTAAKRCWWGDLPSEVRARVVESAQRIPVAGDDPQLIAILAVSSPIRHGALVIDRLSTRAGDRTRDAGILSLLGLAAFAVGDFARAADLLTAPIEAMRGHGRLGLLTESLTLRAFSAIHLGDWPLARSAAEEATRLGLETTAPGWAAAARLAEAVLAGLRGESNLAESLTAAAEALASSPPAPPTLALTQFARGLVALSNARFADAFAHLRRIFDPADASHHGWLRYWTIGYLVEAAEQCGELPNVQAIVSELAQAASSTPSPAFQIGLAYARAVIADGDAEPLFTQALRADLTRWPFARGRLLLAYGSWLRRQRRTVEARVSLRAAGVIFDALGADAWADRTGQQLRAVGDASRQQSPTAAEGLSSQQLQIAQLAADGLSNREIAERLFLSPRTVGSHLYRIYPKLGITSRSQLQAAFNRLDPGSS